MTYQLTNMKRADGDPKVLSTGPSSLGGTDRLARNLGWFSIGLGLTELVAPGMIARHLGLRGRESLLRAYGARELMSGVLTLSVDSQAGMWSRVAGDALDIATVAPALSRDNPKRHNAAMAMAMLGGVALLDALTAQAVSARHARAQAGPRRSYRDRSGYPKGIAAARDAARAPARTQQALAEAPTI